jgi:hypothetical protein
MIQLVSDQARIGPIQTDRSFLLLFFKKEALAFKTGAQEKQALLF